LSTSCNSSPPVSWEDSTDAKLHTHSQLIVTFSWPLCRCCHCLTTLANAASTATGHCNGATGCWDAAPAPLHQMLQHGQCLLLIAAVRSAIQDASCSLTWPVNCCYFLNFTVAVTVMLALLLLKSLATAFFIHSPPRQHLVAFPVPRDIVSVAPVHTAIFAIAPG